MPRPITEHLTTDTVSTVIDINDKVYAYLQTAEGVFLLRILAPVIVGELVKVCFYLVQRARKKENPYLTELSGYAGGVCYGLLMMFSFPNGYTFMQIISIGILLGACAFVIHAIVVRVIGGAIEKKFGKNPFLYGGVINGTTGKKKKG